MNIEGPFSIESIRTVLDFPIPGIQFRDITGLLEDPKAFKDAFEAGVKNKIMQKIDAKKAEVISNLAPAPEVSVADDEPVNSLGGTE